MPARARFAIAAAAMLLWAAGAGPGAGSVRAAGEDGDLRLYRPVQPVQVPAVNSTDWGRNPIDAFVLGSLEAAGLSPAPPADRATLVRRAHYDLIGLPPTPQQVRDFVSDPDPEAYEKLIDRLLDSPHYGEQWGRHWLDLVRWAQTNGYERDGDKPNAWRYRDYIIRAFNEDKPYDRFIREQLAGDELEHVTPDSIIATGYYRLGLWDDEPADREQARFDEFDDLVSTTAQVFLGMTLNCARCHDHKADPIRQADYYGMVAFFRNVRPFSHNRGVYSEFSQTPIASDHERAAHEAAKAQKVERIGRRLAELEAIVEQTFTGPEQDDAKSPQVRAVLIQKKLDAALNDKQQREYKRLQRELTDTPMPPLPSALSVTEFDKAPPPTFILQRGSAHAPGDEVLPCFPSILGENNHPAIPVHPPGASTCGRRRVLADWIASPDNPRTARVMVNRIWQFHFGRGLVRSPNDWGALGDKPTHPKLLDWLANEFVKGGWSIKRMHRLIMTSSAYRMSSHDDARALAMDPANDLLWRFDMRRLSAEEIRDSMLAVNGTLNLQVGGPSVYTVMPQAVLATSSRPDHAWGKSPPDQQVRRSVYIYIKRSLLEHMLSTFDAADTDNSCPVRFATTVPTQALTMLNSDFIQQQARALADRLRREVGEDPAQQVRYALQLVTQREPTDDEIERGLRLMRDFEQADALPREQSLQAFCLLALNLNEFVYLD